MTTDRLWAKSVKHGETPTASHTLPGHLEDVYRAARAVLAATADDQLGALGLDVAAYGGRLRRIVLLAAAVHDLGKANDHFQGMLLKRPDRRDRPQGLRHEWVTVLMLRNLRDWLLPAVAGNEIDFAIVEWAVAGHHPAYNRPSPPRTAEPGVGSTLRVLADYGDFRPCLEWLGKTFDRDEPPTVIFDPWPLTGAGNVFQKIRDWVREARDRWDNTDVDERRMVAAVKNTLIAADVAGSAVPRERPADPAWWEQIGRALGNKPPPGALQAVADLRLGGNEPRGFQKSVRHSTARVTLVKAGCGSGKTLAAYLWAAEKYPDRRLYFCYPTTGTSTEGFKDYLNPGTADLKRDADNAERVRQLEADLFHSRADVDFEVILTAGADADRPAADAAVRSESLDAWSTPVVACTVDTVLGLVQNNKRGLFGWPALAQAAFVFDEIHAYDDRLFGALLRFLKDVPGVPVLLMTASLPDARRKALGRVLGDKLREVPPEPKGLETIPRYKKHAGGDPFAIARAEYGAGGKALWVCNTVGRVMDTADQLVDLNPLIYHSRFKYEDRVKRHKAVVDAFTREHKGGALAVCSQVAEMSLDLKGCTLLITDRATVPALIQRLGRLNRQADKGSKTRPFVVIEPDTHLPYTPADLEAAKDWYDKLPADGISQHDLALAWEQKEAARPPEVVASAWLDGGPSTTVLELREASPGITVLLQPDGDAIRAYQRRVAAERQRAREQHRKIDPAVLLPLPGEIHPSRMARYTVPMPPPPRWLNWRQWKDVNGILIAPAEAIDPERDYDPMRGAKWAEPEKLA